MKPCGGPLSLSPSVFHSPLSILTHSHTFIYSPLFFSSVFCLCSLARCSRHGSGRGLNRRTLVWHRAWHWPWSSATHTRTHRNTHIWIDIGTHPHTSHKKAEDAPACSYGRKTNTEKHKHACKYRRRRMCRRQTSLHTFIHTHCHTYTHAHTITHTQASHPSILAP